MQESATGDTKPSAGSAATAEDWKNTRLLAEWIDPSVTDEHDAVATDLLLDCYEHANGPPFSHDFLARFRAAQIARRDRIETWCRDRLAELRKRPDGPQNETFYIFDGKTHKLEKAI